MSKKICFIIRGENDFLCQEVLHYISYLTVPAGYEIEYSIKKGSLKQAYGEGMKETAAEIKVYLDENVFLIDHSLLLDIVDIFEKNKSIGALGTVGYRINTQNELEERLQLGSCFRIGHGTKSVCRDELGNIGVENVDAMDIRCLFTTVDIEWEDVDDDIVVQNTQLFTDKERVSAVFKKQEPWCLFDNE